MNRECGTPTMVEATFAFCAFKTDQRVQACMITDAIATAGRFRFCVRNSRENLNKQVMYNNRYNIATCNT